MTPEITSKQVEFAGNWRDFVQNGLDEMWHILQEEWPEVTPEDYSNYIRDAEDWL